MAATAGSGQQRLGPVDMDRRWRRGDSKQQDKIFAGRDGWTGGCGRAGTGRNGPTRSLSAHTQTAQTGPRRRGERRKSGGWRVANTLTAYAMYSRLDCTARHAHGTATASAVRHPRAFQRSTQVVPSTSARWTRLGSGGRGQPPPTRWVTQTPAPSGAHLASHPPPPPSPPTSPESGSLGSPCPAAARRAPARAPPTPQYQSSCWRTD